MCGHPFCHMLKSYGLDSSHESKLYIHYVYAKVPKIYAKFHPEYFVQLYSE